MCINKDLFYEVTGINLNKYNLVTKIELEYYSNSSNIRSMSVCTSPIIKNSLDGIYEELEYIGRGVVNINNCSIYAGTENYIILSVKLENSEGTSQRLYEFVKKGE